MGTKRFKAAVIGGSGYGGAELIRRLLAHPDVELARVASIDFVGEQVSTVHPNLEGRTDLRFEGLSPADAARGMDVVLMGLPHKISALKAPEIMATGARIVDLSGDFRLRDPAAYERYYGAIHPCPRELTAGTSTGCPSFTAKRSGRPGTSPRRVASRRRSSSRFCHSPRRGPSVGRSRSSASRDRAAAASRRAPGRTTPSARTTSARTSRSSTSTSRRSRRRSRTRAPPTSRYVWCR
jgi:hypothetical protein